MWILKMGRIFEEPKFGQENKRLLSIKTKKKFCDRGKKST